MKYIAVVWVALLCTSAIAEAKGARAVRATKAHRAAPHVPAAKARPVAPTPAPTHTTEVHHHSTRSGASNVWLPLAAGWFMGRATNDNAIEAKSQEATKEEGS